MTIKTVDFEIRKTETNDLVSCHSCGEIKREIFDLFLKKYLCRDCLTLLFAKIKKALL